MAWKKLWELTKLFNTPLFNMNAPRQDLPPKDIRQRSKERGTNNEMFYGGKNVSILPRAGVYVGACAELPPLWQALLQCRISSPALLGTALPGLLEISSIGPSHGWVQHPLNSWYYRIIYSFVISRYIVIFIFKKYFKTIFNFFFF